MRIQLSLFLALFAISISAQTRLLLDVSKVGAKIQPEMYGVFFEDINFGADGGLYAELIKNRSFDFEHHLVGWLPFGDVQIMSEDPCFDKNPTYVQLTGRNLRTLTGLENEGFRGIGIRKLDEYRFSFYAKVNQGDTIRFRLEIVDSNNDIISTGDLSITDSAWQKHETILTAKKTDAKAKFRIKMLSEGVVNIDHVSLFPVNTWKGRKNGLRKDLVEALYDLNPGVFRFPGGCIVEGNTLETRYQWKNSVGPVENRPININRWNYTFKHKFFPDYYQSYGLGFYEYFLLSEDIGAEPLPVLSVGLSCQFVSEECVHEDEMDQYIQDAVDLVEFANGDVSTKWGKIRAEMGHPEPFNLKLLAIGNEQWGEEYTVRLKLFVDVLREKYPDLKIIGSSGPFPDGEHFEFLWPEMTKLDVDLVDEHYYRSPEWFLENADRYDSYDRNGPKVFAGEYAAHPENRHNSHRAALAEAAFMTGLERNADIVHLATYAPLFAHIDAWQWLPDMIWFDNLKSVRTPNYYVQQLYAQNAGTHVLPITLNNEPVIGQSGLYASAVIDKSASELIVKVVNYSDSEKDIQINLEGLKKLVPDNLVRVTSLQSNDLEVENTLENQLNIIPTAYTTKLTGKSLIVDCARYSFNIYKIGLN